ncbi:hypothetical protein CUROG_08580 [Corynebacterium urogenitale]|uniref:Uncharacterized protein n=1 Tax=Corynebacterium urogenitale TaxID=2487892 RepID=A0A5J6Z822_9CORY|nr:hypothetical protein [Corynebacterium urogenitale]QFQ03064.1 hypothetical protein CUROG_08580 [Corynebacterium urogenitale]
MNITTDPASALRGAKNLQGMQQQWEDALVRARPQVPEGIFGTGLNAKGKMLMELVQRGHEIRLAHARRLKTAGIDGASLIRRVERTDARSADSLDRGAKQR